MAGVKDAMRFGAGVRAGKAPAMKSDFLKNAITLGLIVAVGPFAIDMYLPALPTIAADLGASTAATQMTLMVFFITFGVAQIAFGPISDMVGRKPPLYFGLGVFAIGGIGCRAFADHRVADLLPLRPGHRRGRRAWSSRAPSSATSTPASRRRG